MALRERGGDGIRPSPSFVLEWTLRTMPLITKREARRRLGLSRIEYARLERQVTAVLAEMERKGQVKHSVINGKKVYSLTRKARKSS